jgi:hypothetical protein
MSTATLHGYVGALVKRTMKSGRHPFPGDVEVSNVRLVKPRVYVADVAATWCGVTVGYRARVANGNVTVTRLPNQNGAEHR